MPDEPLVRISVSTQTKQLIDELKGGLSYTEFLNPLVDEKDTE